MSLFVLAKRTTALALAAVLLLGPGLHGHGGHCTVPTSGVHSGLVDCPCCVHSPPELGASPTARVFSLVEHRISSIDGRQGLFGPRHQPFELHLPNAPPVLI